MSGGVQTQRDDVGGVLLPEDAGGPRGPHENFSNAARSSWRVPKRLLQGLQRPGAPPPALPVGGRCRVDPAAHDSQGEAAEVTAPSPWPSDPKARGRRERHTVHALATDARKVRKFVGRGGAFPMDEDGASGPASRLQAQLERIDVARRSFTSSATRLRSRIKSQMFAGAITGKSSKVALALHVLGSGN